jgi:hypothetical protein
MKILAMIAVCILLPVSGRAESEVAAGRWVSPDHMTVSGPGKVGARFFLDIALAADGSFKGSWEAYDACFTSSGPYGINTTSCQRSKKPKPAAGRLDAASKEGKVVLEGLGESALRFKLGSTSSGKPQLEIALPKDWQKQGDPVLYEALLNPK